MKRITQTKEIKTGDNSGVVFSGNEKASYSETFAINEFENNDLITYAIAVELVTESIPQTNSIMPWQSGIPTNEDNYVTHPIGAFEFMFRSEIDANTSEPTLTEGGDAWENLGTSSTFTSWSPIVSYNADDIVDIPAPSGNMFKSLVTPNLNNPPSSGVTDAFWECLGDLVGFFPTDAPYALDEIVIDSDNDLLYRSNVNDNNYGLNDQIGSDWKLIGSKPIAESFGTFTTTDTGQATILIPHSLGAIPSYINPVPKNSFAWALSRAEIDADATNIIITPAFTNNDGATLSYYWEAKV